MKWLTLHSSNVSTLHIVFKLLDLLLQFIERYKFILYFWLVYLRREIRDRLADDKRYLKLPDTKANWHKLGSTPYKTFLLNGPHRLFKFGHVCLIVPRFDFKRDNGLLELARACILRI